MQLLSRQLTTSLASVVLFQEEIARGKRAAKLAALDRIDLSAQLAARTQEAVESETKFTRMAEFVPVGIFIADAQARINYCNDMWYEITKAPRDNGSNERWIDETVKREDREMVRQAMSSLVRRAIPLNIEFRFQSQWIDPNGKKSDTWVLASAYPETGNDGKVKIIFGSITNISQQKWAEHFEKRRMEEAVELKRQQENFIDITSHEMRNPLSAILQCADEITSSLSDYRSQGHRQITNSLMNDCIEAAQTIALCAQHQKRIVDDILTLSKLDSALLLVTPTTVRPVSVVQKSLRMFENELQTADVKLDLKMDPSWRKLNIDCVKLDPSRLLQVLINLTTNAIKFTSTQHKRNILVTLAASTKRLTQGSSNKVSYFPTRSLKKDLTDNAEWGTGEEVYLHFSVQDTGRGLTEAESKLLFMRFSQASPRTHVQYGGSGLGLFISRELVELQGGEIGVSSKAGEGSTFAFYIKARRSDSPPENEDVLPGPARKSATNKDGVDAITTTPKVQPPLQNDALKVLIVEDNVVNQRVLQKQLLNRGCVVYVANHGEECIEWLKHSEFWAGQEKTGKELTVVLMDQEMPIMDGLTCTRKIRELQKSGQVVRHVPIIAVTANARDEQIETLRKAGMVSVSFDASLATY